MFFTLSRIKMTDHIGLANIGNTCFLNVVLQALRHAPPIVDIFLTDKDATTRDASSRKELLSGFQTLIRDFWTVQAQTGAKPSLVPRGFFHSLHTTLRETEDDWYRPGQQCDAAEAMQYILDSLHDAMYRRVRMEVSGTASTDEEGSHVKAIKSWADFFSREYSPIVNNFNGQYQIKITCEKCGNVSERYEPWLMIKAPIPGADKVGAPAPTMSRCLDAAFESETISDYACEKCATKTTAILQHKISRLPPVVILSLKRFTNTGLKVRGQIGWSLDEMDYSPWMAFRRDPFSDSRDAPIYTTFAVIEHHGSTHGGHYRMYARDLPTADSGSAASEWSEYDDSSVRTVAPEHVVTPDSYIALMVPKARADDMYEAMRGRISSARRASASATAVAAEA